MDCVRRLSVLLAISSAFAFTLSATAAADASPIDLVATLLSSIQERDVGYIPITARLSANYRFKTQGSINVISLYAMCFGSHDKSNIKLSWSPNPDPRVSPPYNEPAVEASFIQNGSTNATLQFFFVKTRLGWQLDDATCVDDNGRFMGLYSAWLRKAD